jgi:hypothetical protein
MWIDIILIGTNQRTLYTPDRGFSSKPWIIAFYGFGVPFVLLVAGLLPVLRLEEE